MRIIAGLATSSSGRLYSVDPGMNKVITLIQDGNDMGDADIFYPPTLVIPAIEPVAMKFCYAGSDQRPTYSR